MDKQGVKFFGSRKNYLFVKMQLAVLLSAVIAIFYTIFKGEIYLLQILPAALLMFSFAELYKNYKRDFWLYFAIFLILFITVLLAPLAFRAISANAGNPAELIKYLTYVIMAFIIVLLLSRVSLKKDIYGKVVLADRDIAVVDMDFDLIAGVRNGRYAVENHGAKKGDSVRVAVKKGFFSGAQPYRIIGKV